MCVNDDDKDLSEGGDPPNGKQKTKSVRLSGSLKRVLEDLLWELWESGDPKLQKISVKLKARYM